MKLNNISEIVDNGGEITIGRVGPIRCGATACDEAECLVMLVRRSDESFEELLERLDAAIEDAVENGNYIDEINP